MWANQNQLCIRVALLASAANLWACSLGGLDSLGSGSCPAGLVPGELVITEIMANPAVDTPGHEWLEVFNTGSRLIDLAGVELTASRPDGSDPASHVMGAAIIESGQYLVIGSVNEPISDYAHYIYGDALGELADDGGRLSIYCEPFEIDAVVYEPMAAGVAQGLSASIAPDHLANDDSASWCASTTQLAASSTGTPGMANDCVPAVTCADGGVVRGVVLPQPGDLIITELMANPAAASDATAEWLEVFATRDIDLNGLVLGREPDVAGATVQDSACLHVPANSYAVLARSTNPGDNGALPGVDGEFGLSLVQSNGRLILSAGGVVLDEVTWASSSSGKAASLDPSRLDPVANDDPESWCTAVAPYGAGDLGTPGTANPRCFLPEGMCEDGDVLRPVVPVQFGDLVITEYMANPAAPLSDTTAEWFEIRVDADADLNGMQLGRNLDAPELELDATSCMRVSAGTHLLFARSADTAVNGSLPEPTAMFRFTMVNGSTSTPGRIFAMYGGELLDEITYTASTSGHAASRDDAGAVPTWCLAQAPYAEANHGTPGAANPACSQE